MVTTYDLYLEGLANEVAHVLQQIRRELNLEIMDSVDVCLVQAVPDKLTSSIYMFVDKIVERVRIAHFYSNKHFDSGLKTCEFICSLGHTYKFDAYMKVHK